MNYLNLLKKSRYALCRWQTCVRSVAILSLSLLISNPDVNAQSITGVTAVCPGSSSLLSILSVGGNWSSSNTGIVTVSSGGVITGVSAGTATITYATVLGLAITTGVTVNPLPNPGTISGGSQVCVGSTISLVSSGDAGGSWSSLFSFVSVISSTGVVTGSNIGLETIKYTVTNGCGSAFSTATVDVVAAVNHIYTLAGNGVQGFGGDGGPAYSSTINNPRDLFTNNAGDVYFCDLVNNRVRKISRTGIITTIAGTGIAGNTGDGGAATLATLSGPNGVFVDNSGNVLISNTNVHTIRKINGSGVISTIAGTPATSGFSGDGGPATAARMFAPQGVLADASGNIYIADQGNNRIRKIDASTGIITTVAGNGTATYRATDDGGPATAAQLSVRGITMDKEGSIYIADPSNNRIRKYIPSTGIITTFAGTGTTTRTGDGGPATAAGLAAPARFAYDGANILYITDQNNQCIRSVNMVTGIINTVAGNTTAGFSGDGGLATASQFRGPVGIAADRFGNFFIADANNARIRIVNSMGSVAISSSGPTHVCASATVTLNAFSSVTGNMSVQWQKNGSNVGGNSTTYVESSPANGDVFRCVITITPPCGGSFMDTSNIVTLIVDPAVSSITGVGSSLCAGSSATLSNTAPGGTWSTSSSAASISPTGVLTAISSGTAVISYSVPNICGTNTATLSVNIAVPSSITASASSNGTISPSGITNLCGGNQAYAIIPATGYHVTGVTVDGSSVGAVTTYTFTSVSSSHTISAAFAINTYSITASAGTNGAITPSGTFVVNYGDAPSYTITPATGYHISDVQVDGASVGAISTYTFSAVSVGHTISASFAINTYSITASAGGNGSITPSGTSVVNFGDAPVFSISPAAGYRIDDVQIDGSSIGAVNSYTFSPVSAGHTISAAFAVNTFSITASAGPDGTISPSGTSVVSSGGTASFVFTPATGYHISDVQVDGSSVGAVSSYTFSSVSAGHTLSAAFAINSYTVVATSGSNGSITPGGTSAVNYGDNLSYAIVPAAGHHITDVLIDGTSVGAVNTYTFTAVATSHTIDAAFAINTCTLTATSNPNGAIFPSGATTVNWGDTQTYAFIPATGYHVSNVTVDGVSIGAVTSFTFSGVAGNHTLAATFAINTYSVTASAGANGTVTPSGTSVVNYGDAPAFTFTPATGYHVTDVQVDGSSVGAMSSYTFSPVSAGHNISATFAINTFSVTASAGTNGIITPSGTSVVNYSDAPSFTFTPVTGYHVSDVQVDGSSVGAALSYTFSPVSASHTISVSFAINTYSITASAPAHGTITPSGTSVVSYGGAASFAFAPATGYHISDIQVDGSSVGAVSSYTFTAVTASHTISAVFTANTFSVTASVLSKGSVSPAGTSTVSYGDTPVYTFTPNSGYHVSNISVDGVSVGAASSYTFSPITSSHSLVTSFSINTYTLTASAGSHGSISPSGASIINYGSTTAYTITPATGYHVDDVLVDGTSVGAVTSYTFVSVTGSHTISASFAINTYTVAATAGSNGSVSPSGTTNINYGGSQVYTITPGTGYHVTGVTVDGSSIGAVSTYTFTSVSASHTISATFAINTYTVTASAGSHGSISPSGSTSVSYGSDQVYIITPSSGYRVDNVTVDGASIGAVSTYTLTAVATSHSISASFTLDVYTISASSGPHGSISPSGSTTVSSGDSEVYTITPNSGYVVSDVVVDGVSVGAVTSYTFTSISADHTISVTFDSDGTRGRGHKDSDAKMPSADHTIIFPNPTSGIFNVIVPADEKEAIICVRDMAGRTIITKMITDNDGQSVQVNLTGTAKGVYIVSISAGIYSGLTKISLQ